jgi:hypothetical protein
VSALSQLQEHPTWRRVANAADRHKLLVALILAVFATLTLTALSLSMYYVNGFYRYDLSRPTYAKERTELAKPESQKVYDTTSPITKSAIDDFLKEFDDRAKNLQAYGDFRDASLNDEDLLIAPPAEAQQ